MTVGKPPLHEPGTAFENDERELYHLEEDFNEVHNLAEVEPERLRHLQTCGGSRPKPIRCYRQMIALRHGSRRTLSAIEVLVHIMHSGPVWVIYPAMSHQICGAAAIASTSC